MRVANPEIFRSCINSESLEHLTRLSLIYSKVILTDSELAVRTTGINNDPLRFHDQLETLLNISGSFARFARQAAERKKMTVRIPKELAEAENNCSPAPDEVNTEPARQDKNSAEPVRREITRPDNSAEPVRQNPSEPQVASGDDLPLNQSAFLRHLWQSGSPTGRQKELFAPYAGREVEWEGILKMCYAYSSDFVFGKEGGVKATFELEEFKPEGSFLPIRIKAVAAFPKTEFDKLGKASGKKFRFRGKLLKIEPIAREIYLSSASSREHDHEKQP